MGLVCSAGDVVVGEINLRVVAIERCDGQHIDPKTDGRSSDERAYSPSRAFVRDGVARGAVRR